jgi:serine/threonine protein phosphatase PrpC
VNSQIALHAAYGTHPGQIRNVNQDSVLAMVREGDLGVAVGLFVVADGMGGHQAGEVASQLAVDTIKDNLDWMLDEDDAGATVFSPSPNPDLQKEEPASNDPIQRRLELAVEEANRVIYEYARKHPKDAGNLGCTVTCAMVYGNKAFIANVGDSRAYRWRQGELTRLTEDHSYVWQLVNEGYISEEEIFDHPQRNVVTRALGNQPQVKVDVELRELESGDRLLLCSDGVWEMIRDPHEIASILEVKPLEKAVKRLIDKANGYGGYDNIGVVIVEVQSLDES